MGVGLLGSVAGFFRLIQSETPSPSPVHNPRTRPGWCHILAEYELSPSDRVVSGCRPMRALLGHRAFVKVGNFMPS